MTVRVVYILGAAYSGSTVLGALLGSHPDIVCLGEIARWTRYTNPGVRRCACGELAVECPFWMQVARAWKVTSDAGTHAEYAARQRRYERIRDIPSIHMGGWPARSDFDTYRRDTRLLIEAIATLAARDTLVDTSKQPARGLALAMTEGVDVRFIHLVRDGLAYVDSCARREGHGAGAGAAMHVPAGLAFRASLNWAWANLASEEAIRAARRPWVRIRYESLAADPYASLMSLSDAVGIPLEAVGRRTAGGEPMAFGHMVAGNDLRLRGSVPFRSHSDAGRAAAPTTKRLFRLVAGSLARRYGYFESR